MGVKPLIDERYTLCTLTEAAEAMGITRQRATFIEKKALRKIREQILLDPTFRDTASDTLDVHDVGEPRYAENLKL